MVAAGLVTTTRPVMNNLGHAPAQAHEKLIFNGLQHLQSKVADAKMHIGGAEYLVRTDRIRHLLTKAAKIRHPYETSRPIGVRSHQDREN